MTEYENSKSDDQLEELLLLTEQMQEELDQKDRTIEELKVQLDESLTLNERLNSENRAGNIQALKNDLRKTKELLQSEKEKTHAAEIMTEECQDKLRQAEQERDYALSHQKKVEIPVEKPVLYQKCGNCNQTAYLKAKEKYDTQRKKLAGISDSSTTSPTSLHGTTSTCRRRRSRRSASASKTCSSSTAPCCATKRRSLRSKRKSSRCSNPRRKTFEGLLLRGS